MVESRKDVLPEVGQWLPQAARLFREFQPVDLGAGKPLAEQLEDSSAWKAGVPVGVALAAIMRELSRVSIEGMAAGAFEQLCPRCWGDGLAVPHDTDDLDCDPPVCPNVVCSPIADTGDYAYDCGCDRVPCPSCDKGKLRTATAELQATRNAFKVAVEQSAEVRPLRYALEVARANRDELESRLRVAVVERDTLASKLKSNEQLIEGIGRKVEELEIGVRGLTRSHELWKDTALQRTRERDEVAAGNAELLNALRAVPDLSSLLKGRSPAFDRLDAQLSAFVARASSTAGE